MCGIVGMVGNNPINQDIYDALLLLQHRGQDSTGMATVEDGGHMHLFRARVWSARPSVRGTCGPCSEPPGWGMCVM